VAASASWFYIPPGHFNLSPRPGMAWKNAVPQQTGRAFRCGSGSAGQGEIYPAVLRREDRIRSGN